jgi:O-antigen/teichoic acid export membrane protein
MSGSLRRIFVRGSTLLGGSSAALAASFLHTVVVARALGPGDFGVWAGIQAYCLVVASFVTFRTSEPLTRYLVEFRSRGDGERTALLLGTAMTVDGVTQVVAVLAMMALAPLLAPGLAGGAAAASLYPVVAVGMLRGAFDPTWFSVARDLGRYQTIATLNAAFPVLRLGVTTVLWLTGGVTLPALAWLMMGIGLIQMAVTGACLWRALSGGYGLAVPGLFAPARLRRQSEIAPFWNFMKATFLWSLFTGLVKEGDVLILGSLRGAEEVGWYRLARSLVSTTQSVAEMLAQVIYQDFSELVVARNGALLRRTAGVLARSWLPLVAGGVALAIVLADPVIPAVFGAAYGPATGVFSILLVGSGAVTMLFWVRPLALAFELHWYNFHVVVWSSLAFAVLDVLFIQAWGLTGAAAAYALIAAAGPLALLPPVLARLGRVAVP